MSEETPHQPHDKLFKTSFSEPETAAAFLKTQVPPALAARLHWDSLRVEAGSFIDEQLHGSESDLLYRVDLEGEDAFFYVLFEHQRQEDYWLSFRLLGYLLRIWEKFRKGHPSARQLPPVIPVVLAQNATPWKPSLRFHDLVAIPSGLEAEVLPLTPGFVYQLVQLAELPFDKIVGTPLGILTLRALKAEQVNQLLADAVWDQDLMLRVSAPLLRAWLRYLYHAGEIDKEGFVRKLEGFDSTELRERTMTLAQQFRQEGIQKGRQEGELRLLRRLLQRRFGELPAWVENRLASASVDDLERWSDRVFDAVILEDVFG